MAAEKTGAKILREESADINVAHVKPLLSFMTTKSVWLQWSNLCQFQF